VLTINNATGSVSGLLIYNFVVNYFSSLRWTSRYRDILLAIETRSGATMFTQISALNEMFTR
jgi:hypothetical protein